MVLFVFYQLSVILQRIAVLLVPPGLTSTTMGTRYFIPATRMTFRAIGQSNKQPLLDYGLCHTFVLMSQTRRLCHELRNLTTPLFGNLSLAILRLTPCLSRSLVQL